jgi:hypothetical protein
MIEIMIGGRNNRIGIREYAGSGIGFLASNANKCKYVYPEFAVAGEDSRNLESGIGAIDK